MITKYRSPSLKLDNTLNQPNPYNVFFCCLLKNFKFSSAWNPEQFLHRLRQEGQSPKQVFSTVLHDYFPTVHQCPTVL